MYLGMWTLDQPHGLVVGHITKVAVLPMSTIGQTSVLLCIPHFHAPGLKI